MKTTKSIIMVMLIAAMFSQVGCATHMTYQSNKAQSQARGMQDPSVMQVVRDNPWSTAAAAAVDAALAYGAYEGIRSIDSGSNDEDKPVEQRGDTANHNTSGGNTTIVQGNGNQVSITTVPPIEPEAVEPIVEE